MLELRPVLFAMLLAACAGSRGEALPPEVATALQRARVPEEALSVVVRELSGHRSVLTLQAERSVNPASLTKLLTTYAALDRLGPGWSWATPVWVVGTLKDGVLDGSVHIKGSGDPKLVIERVWLLLRRLQQAGVQDIRGDILLDGSAFAVPEGSAADFDGDPTRPYNVRPSALLLNYKSVNYTFVPDIPTGLARVLAEPALAGTAVDRSVPLTAGACSDWRSTLKPSFGDSVRFAGSYPVACGEQAWAVADLQPATYNARLLEALWKSMGGRLGGSIREGPAPTETPPSFELRSPPLAEVVRDINKFSNNVMAQQLFFTLGASPLARTPATAEAAREALRGWMTEKLGELPPGTVIDNGSGLSRETRMTAQTLARVLTLAFDSPVMPEFVASLPIAGIDGTMRRSRATAGRAHLKTGSLRDVAAVAGYVISDSGRRYVVVALIQHANANTARPAFDALLQWIIRDAPAR